MAAPYEAEIAVLSAVGADGLIAGQSYATWRDFVPGGSIPAGYAGTAEAFKWGDPPTMAGVNLGQHVQIFLHQGVPGPQGCSMYFVVSNADELYEFHRANGVELLVAPADRDYGLRDYSVRDLYGYRLDFGHRLVEPDCD